MKKLDPCWKVAGQGNCFITVFWTDRFSIYNVFTLGIRQFFLYIEFAFTCVP